MASLLGAVAVESRTSGQHGKEQTPGLVETVLSYNKDNQEETAYYNHSVHRTHRDGDPDMQIFQSRDLDEIIPHIMGVHVI